MRSLALVCLFGFLTWSSPSALYGADSHQADRQDHGVRINIAGRQRMLVQRMAKAACFVMAGIEPERHADMAWMAEHDFSEALTALVEGDPDRHIAPAHEPDIAAQLAVVSAHYETYGPSILQVVHGDRHSIILSQILELNIPTLVEMNAAVGLMQQSAGDTGADPAFSKTVNIAGRQRMLSQLMSKSFCFVALGIDADRQRVLLAKAKDEFHTVLAALETGDVAQNILPPPTFKTKQKLARVRELWTQILPALEAAISGGGVTDQHLARVAQLNDPLLKEMNAGVVSYLEAN